MKLNITATIFALILTLILTGCDEEKKSTKTKEGTKTEQKATQSSKGESNVMLLENNGFRIPLPNGFKRKSVAEYGQYLEKNYSNKTLNYEKDRLRKLRSRDGEFYLFFNEENKSSLTINVVDPLAFSNEDPQGLLNMITSLHTEAKEATDREFEKITAGFSNNQSISIFKALYKVTEKGKNKPMYEHSYVITNEDMSMMMTLDTPDDVDLDPYIEKIQL